MVPTPRVFRQQVHEWFPFGPPETASPGAAHTMAITAVQALSLHVCTYFRISRFEQQ